MANHSNSRRGHGEPKPLPTDPQAAIDTKQLGVMLNRSPITIEQERARGEGPPFFRLGDGKRSRVRYRLADVQAWIAARTIGRVA